jgi:hypothetical protein
MRLVKNFPPSRRSLPFLLLTLALLLLLARATASAQSSQAGDRKKKTQDVTLIPSVPVTTAFTYQGRLTDGSNPANGLYDMQFKLYDVETNGAPLPHDSPIIRELTGVQVTNGVFTVKLDFGSFVFNDGGSRFLEIGVRHSNASQPETFTLLSPRQQLTSTPYAIRSNSAASSDFAAAATSATTAVNALQLGGTDASLFVQTDDPRLSNSRQPAAGSANYIQNSTTQQTGATFNIDGNGKVGGTLSANSVSVSGVIFGDAVGGSIINATTQFSFNNQRVLTAPGDNTVTGIAAGHDATGFSNSFYGNKAGAANTTGAANSFFGASAGKANKAGNHNSFFGTGAGVSNVSGSENAFFGSTAGSVNVSGFGNSFFGTNAGKDNTASRNSYFGAFAGELNTTGVDNSYFGNSAGRYITTGSSNSFFGSNAGAAIGASDATGSDNAFFGKDAGMVNTAGTNSFFGASAGSSNTTGSGNNFFGWQAGHSNTTGTNNIFIGSIAGDKSKSGHSNIFIGQFAGGNNTSGQSNIFIGGNTGLGTTTESGNTLIGINAHSSPGVTNSTAIGYQASVSQSNSLVLGDAQANVSVGVGVTAPKSKLHVGGGNLYIGSAGQGIILKSPNGSVCRLLAIDNTGAIALSSITCP